MHESWIKAPALGKDGFAPDFQDVMPLLYGRQEFFPESEKICALFIQEMSKTENMLDANREEWRGYQKKGSLFFVAVILLDWLVCSL